MNSRVKNVLGVNLKGMGKKELISKENFSRKSDTSKDQLRAAKFELRSWKRNGKINSKSVSTNTNECLVSILN